MASKHLGGCDEPLIVVDDHFGGDLAVEIDELPHIDTALAIQGP
ncbi:hypothetical protein [Mycobacteroides abscessus]|nr:hypothetical protein [Mycobacteroides abscessus]SLF47121.1 Uncharacterised protein [Mycobacteroides abscessus subsp. abscessus]